MKHVVKVTSDTGGVLRGNCSVCGANSRLASVPSPTRGDPSRRKIVCVNSLFSWKGNKYRAKPTTTAEGISFASTKEARRWEQLKLLEKAGAIHDLRRQVPFRITVNGHLICKYIADFVYRERGCKRETVEDVKGYRTRVYALKRKLLRAVHNVDIKET